VRLVGDSGTCQGHCEGVNLFNGRVVRKKGLEDCTAVAVGAQIDDDVNGWLTLGSCALPRSLGVQ
jgi:hypothetical protein